MISCSLPAPHPSPATLLNILPSTHHHPPANAPPTPPSLPHPLPPTPLPPTTLTILSPPSTPPRTPSTHSLPPIATLPPTPLHPTVPPLPSSSRSLLLTGTLTNLNPKLQFTRFLMEALRSLTSESAMLYSTLNEHFPFAQ